MTRNRFLTACSLFIVFGFGTILFMHAYVSRDFVAVPPTEDSPHTEDLPSGNSPIQPTRGREDFIHPISLSALSEREFNGRDLKLGRVLAENESYTRYYITYKSGELTISGIMNIPKGEGPFPLLVLNHGYIDPAVYTNGRGLKREQDYLARSGYAVIHPDYRNHAESDTDVDDDLRFRLGYTEDVINAIIAVREAKLPSVDVERVGMLGHSMGGGIALNVMAVRPDLVQGFVLFAPVSGDYRDNFERWTMRRLPVAQEVEAEFGTPETNSEFWYNVSAINFLGALSSPVMVHHGSADASVPIRWSERLASVLKELGKQVTYYVYPNEPHEFAGAWPTVMERTTHFFDQYVKK